MKTLAAVGFLLLVACAQIAVGLDFDKTKVDQLVKGRTSKEEVVKIFGDPTERGTRAGVERWVYVNRITSASPKPEWFGLSYRGDTKEKMLVIIFDQETVKDFSFSETSRPFVSNLGLR